jgi:RNA polymerase sigma factor (sigma-70 family)
MDSNLSLQPTAGGSPQRTNTDWQRVIDRDTKTLMDLYKDAYYFARQHIALNGCKSGRVSTEAKDVTQEAFARFFSKSLEVERAKGASPDSLVIGIIRNVWYDRLRQRSKESRIFKFSVLKLTDRAEDVELATKEKLTADLIQGVAFSALENTLKAKCRILIDRIYFEGITREEIAVEQGLTYDAVKQKVNRCRKALLDIINERLKRQDPG